MNRETDNTQPTKKDWQGLCAMLLAPSLVAGEKEQQYIIGVFKALAHTFIGEDAAKRVIKHAYAKARAIEEYVMDETMKRK